jgi:hypothetical protein
MVEISNYSALLNISTLENEAQMGNLGCTAT